MSTCGFFRRREILKSGNVHFIHTSPYQPASKTILSNYVAGILYPGQEGLKRFQRSLLCRVDDLLSLVNPLESHTQSTVLVSNPRARGHHKIRVSLCRWRILVPVLPAWAWIYGSFTFTREDFQETKKFTLIHYSPSKQRDQGKHIHPHITHQIQRQISRTCPGGFSHTSRVSVGFDIALEICSHLRRHSFLVIGDLEFHVP